VKTILREFIKYIGAYLGITLKRDRSRDWQLYLYPESKRPLIPTYVNLGAGGFYHPMWTNVDMPNAFYKKQQEGNIHVYHNLVGSQPFPFDTESVSIFYTSHTIEHLPDQSVKNLFNEVHRCLKYNGLFRLACPDMEIQYRAYQNKDQYFWPQPSPWSTKLPTLEDRFLEHFATALTEYHSSKNMQYQITHIPPEEIKYLFNTKSMEAFFDEITLRIPDDSNTWLPEGHCNWFTSSKVCGMLKEVNFTNVYTSGYGQSADPRLRNIDQFDSTCPELSLYIECTK
jgi:predicted SAM-dependent methyltransferase